MEIRWLDVCSLESELSEYERKYRLQSADFRRLFGQGEFPHTFDSVEWAQLYDELQLMQRREPTDNWLATSSHRSRTGVPGPAFASILPGQSVLAA